MQAAKNTVMPLAGDRRPRNAKLRSICEFRKAANQRTNTSPGREGTGVETGRGIRVNNRTVEEGGQVRNRMGQS